MIERTRIRLVSNPLIRALVRLLPSGSTTTIRGCATARIPVTLVPYIVRRIEADGIHDSPTRLRLDGGRLHDLYGRGAHPDLTLRELVGLYDAAHIGLESAALTFNGDVVVHGVDPCLIARARARGATTGFRRVTAMLGMAMFAADRSGRPLSGAC